MGHYVYVPIGGDNRLQIYALDPRSGKLTLKNELELPLPGRQECSVTVYHLDTSKGTLKAVQTVSTLPDEGFDGAKSNAQLHIHPDGRAVYASNRGPDSIAIDATSGAITSLGQQPVQKIPRSFGIDPDGDFLISGADHSNILTSFRIDSRDALDLVEECDIGGTSAWVLPVKVPA